MHEIELFLKEKFNPVYRAWYAAWVLWWPIWRNLFSGRNIQRKWEHLSLLKDGQSFLDYGCGTGWFSIEAAKIVGATGRVYALDCFPRQLEEVNALARKKGLNNITTILSDCETGLPDVCVDAIWMCDVFHEIKLRREVLAELRRILKNGGTLTIYDGMKDEVLKYTTGSFSLINKEGKLLHFSKI